MENTNTARKIFKVLSPGFNSQGRLFVAVKYDGVRLSITGVEGPKANGDARGPVDRLWIH